jgi:hypothetical protein
MQHGITLPLVKSEPDPEVLNTLPLVAAAAALVTANTVYWLVVIDGVKLPVIPCVPVNRSTLLPFSAFCTSVGRSAPLALA